jgi:hypothetical protein
MMWSLASSRKGGWKVKSIGLRISRLAVYIEKHRPIVFKLLLLRQG